MHVFKKDIYFIGKPTCQNSQLNIVTFSVRASVAGWESSLPVKMKHFSDFAGYTNSKQVGSMRVQAVYRSRNTLSKQLHYRYCIQLSILAQHYWPRLPQR